MQKAVRPCCLVTTGGLWLAGAPIFPTALPHRDGLSLRTSSGTSLKSSCLHLGSLICEVGKLSIKGTNLGKWLVGGHCSLGEATGLKASKIAPHMCLPRGERE
jgi:hypothetical protein